MLAFCDGGYTTNLPLEDLTGGKRDRLRVRRRATRPQHGAPARLLVTHLYFWKSAKWVRGLELRDYDAPGFWEYYGYHNYGDRGKSSATAATELAAGNRGRSRRGDRPNQEHHSRDEGLVGHRAGQHVDVRLTAEDGYQAQRSYSIASAPEDADLVLTVERLDDGEVSPYLVDELRPGDELELRGPIGGYFVWEARFGGPLLLVAGGSGVAPFRAILRHHRAIRNTTPIRLLYSARTFADVIYREELMMMRTRYRHASH